MLTVTSHALHGQQLSSPSASASSTVRTRSSTVRATPLCSASRTLSSFFLFFFFQAEDGIRDHCVTGVQTCALPIFRKYPPHRSCSLLNDVDPIPHGVHNGHSPIVLLLPWLFVQQGCPHRLQLFI